MGELLAEVAGHRTLLAAWQEVYDNAAADGDPGTAVLAFEKDVLSRLQALAETLRGGQWRPDPVHQIDIAKPDGHTRGLRIGSVEDRIIERAALTVLDPLIDPLLQPTSFAYRRGLGVRPAVAALVDARDQGHHYVVRCDITDCFDRIPRWPVLTQLRGCVPDAELCHLVQLLVFRHVTGVRNSGGDGRGLHQGSALSPLLCNLYLDRFDQEMLAQGWRPIRYSDDLAIPAMTKTDAQSALVAAGEVLETLDLDLNAGKSQIAGFDEGVGFLGQTVTARTQARGDRYDHPLEATVFVTTEDALVRRRGERLQVEKNGEKLLGVGLNRVRQVVCTGRVGVTTGFLEAASRRDIDVVWLYDDGAFCTRLHHTYSGDVGRRRDQFRFADQPAACLKLARHIVRGKINNMQAHLRRAAQHGTTGLDETTDRLTDARSGLDGMGNLEQLRGAEGRATRDYFGGLARILGEPWQFTSRQRRPPPDPVNAMLSFGYTLLTNEAVAALETAGLDPYVGALHAERRGRPSLALDLMEEYRPMVVDAMIVRLVSTQQITPTDFVTDETAGSCRLTDDGRRRFLSGYERRMLTLFRHTNSGRTVSYRVSLLLQARQLSKVFAGLEPTYLPVVWR